MRSSSSSVQAAFVCSCCGKDKFSIASLITKAGHEFEGGSVSTISQTKSDKKVSQFVHLLEQDADDVEVLYRTAATETVGGGQTGFLA